MAKPANAGRGNAQGKGLDKEREIYDADGNRVEGATQRDWMNRGEDSGWTRPEDEEPVDELEEAPEGEEVPAAPAEETAEDQPVG